MKNSNRRLLTLRFLLLSVFCFVASIAQAGNGKRVALLIGVSDYQHLQVLKNPVKDVRLLQTLFKNDLRFDEVITIENPDRDKMAEAIAMFEDKAKNADAAVIYYSGHGVQNTERRNYLIPRDKKVDSDASLKANAIPAEYLVDALAGATTKLIILDACRDTPNGKKGGSKGLARMNGENEGLLIAYATEEGKTAEDGNGDNSPYAKALATHLKTNKPIMAQFDAVARAVRQEVPTQKPQRYGNLESDVYLSLFGKAPATTTGNNTKPEPLTASNRPGQTSGLNLDDLEKEEATRKEWSNWQARMKVDYDKINQFKGSADLQVKAWDRFLSGWAENNPFSQEDETLRSQAQNQREQAKRTMQAAVQHQQNNQVVVSGSNTIGKTFKDCPECPEMVMLPSGSFQMGSNDGDADEKPVHSVSINAFALGKTEVTRGQFAAFVAATGHNAGKSCWVLANEKWADTAGRNWRNPGFSQTDNDPVVCVNWDDAQAYVRWLAQKSGKRYRLPSEAEWEYACRAGSNQTYCGSDNVDSVAVYGRKSGDKTQPVASKQANAWGLFDMSGNVWEWTQDCWNETYNGAPGDGDTWQSGNCGRRVLRGGSWSGNPAIARAAFRSRSYGSTLRYFNLGFRVARMLP